MKTSCSLWGVVRLLIVVIAWTAAPLESSASILQVGRTSSESMRGRAVRGGGGPGPLTLDFETQDDFTTPLVNGQVVTSRATFGNLLQVEGFPASGLTAAIFDSNPAGPNATSSDPDLLVDQGNVLILQENPERSGGIYELPDDDARGGEFVFAFAPDAVEVLSLDLIDLCPAPMQGALVRLIDCAGQERAYVVPSGWTGDAGMDGPPGVGTLDLRTLAMQPGVAAAAVAYQNPGFDSKAVVELHVTLGGSGALDNLVFDPGPVRDPLAIVGCSLGCSADELGFVSCSVTDVPVNGAIGVTFNRPLDLASVNSNSFQVVDLNTGQTPPGFFRLDSGDARTLLFEPLLVFDSAGNPLFGFEDGATYSLRIPGTLEGPTGPFVRTCLDEPNTTPLSCVVVASMDVVDCVPGSPVVAVTVDVVTGYDSDTGEPNAFDLGVPASGASNVFLGTNITFAFDDLMNPATLVDPVTGESPSLSIVALTNAGEVPLAGTFSIGLDQVAKRTSVVFDPADELPANATTIEVRIGRFVQDLGGNAVANPAPVAFTTEP